MIGDSLSDAHLELVKAIGTRYRESFKGMPPELQGRVLGLLSDLDVVRQKVDQWEISVTFNSQKRKEQHHGS